MDYYVISHSNSTVSLFVCYYLAKIVRLFHRSSKITVTAGRAAAFSNFFQLSVDIMTLYCVSLFQAPR